MHRRCNGVRCHGRSWGSVSCSKGGRMCKAARHQGLSIYSHTLGWVRLSGAQGPPAGLSGTHKPPTEICAAVRGLGAIQRSLGILRTLRATKSRCLVLAGIGTQRSIRACVKEDRESKTTSGRRRPATLPSRAVRPQLSICEAQAQAPPQGLGDGPRGQAVRGLEASEASHTLLKQ
ncbi:hypothetical protein E2C01_079799 [Portunus trituberculatus]|uniref:Uncharacterized protein n=1 Tax=Portunus trituberculatus TaxID=210409 RepID=A0A5B7IHU0_PORTR|nr:hypothetical protein [Portunus trituberculatus]